MKENSREEDIEELKRLLYRNELSQYGKRKLINYYEQQEKDYKRVLKENEELLEVKVSTSAHNRILELEKENKELKLYNNSITSQLEQMTTEKFKNGWFHQSEFKDSIPVQKVKDKIEEYKNMLKTCNKAKDIDRIKAINERILELQELLEGRK